ncbi:MAG TPA: hypothetical protein ACFYD7_08640 [Candidatus Wujingus californicus]|uniref:hypothetical protein n=1 Tax=Candidatus Wujingus californicus TaxID=3367618 RepID=UPI001DCF6F19|nr:hypothetical protein [Planctomycetota bacterium]
MKKIPAKDELSNIDIALFALYKAGGISKKVHTEKIAWEAYQLAKERFSWRLPEFRKKGFPDKTPVRFALEQAKKKENGKLVAGRAGGDINRPELEGWRFTPEGAEWFKNNESRILKALKLEAPDMPKLEAEHFIKQLKNDSAFISFTRNGNLDEVSSYMFTDMLACAPDAPKEIIKQKFERLSTSANLANNKEIINFLKACETKFSQFITD